MADRVTVEDIFEGIGHGVIITDRAGRVDRINRTALTALEVEGKDAIGNQVGELLPRTGSEVDDCLKTGQGKSGLSDNRGRTGLLVDISPISGERNRAKGAVITLRISRPAENYVSGPESFQSIARQFEIIFQTSSDGIWICDGNGNILALNRASERLNGVNAEEVVGQNVRIMTERNIVDDNITPDVIRTRQTISKMQFIKRTGRYLMVTGNPAYDEKGNLTLVVVNERDMTQLTALQKKLEEALIEKEKTINRLEELSLVDLESQNIVAQNEMMRRICGTALKLSRNEVSNILILGETGTGKGLISSFMHRNSPRAHKPFIQINCAALPENLLEAELFGYEKGAFTGAGVQGKAGLFELAHEGTLFLDEIGDMPMTIQAKLLKYLDDYEIIRLGGTRYKKINCLILAATNQDLEKLVRAKRFRRDLFHRLNSFTLNLPALRERPEDIFELSHHYLAVYNRKYGTKKIIGPEGVKALKNHYFPGNVRELKNLIKEAVVICENRRIDDFLTTKLLENKDDTVEYPAPVPSDKAFGFHHKMNAFEKKLLVQAAAGCRSTIELAHSLDISQATAFRKMRKYGLSFNK